LQITENAKKVLENRILRKDEEGNVIETPEEMLVRVARAIADNETEFDKFDWKEKFYDIMDNLYFLPNSPCLMNAGIPGGQLMACFVLPIEDNMESIMGTLRDAALIHKSGGGTGFSFSNIRPENDIVKTTGGIASGPVSFIRMYDAVTNEIKQGGKRRGANIAVLKCDHGDILKFIDCKRNNSQINNFNISVAVTDKFMKAVKANKDFELINPRNGEVTKTLPAKEIWDKLVEGAWQNGEPGIIFIDTVNEYNPLPELGEIVGTNPCGESVLLNNESCCLGSINLTKIVTSDKEINWDLLEKVARIATRFLDNILDITEYPLPQIEEMSLGNRKIGLGVMGWGDMLFKLGIPYNSQEALDLAWKVMGVVDEEAFMASHVIAEEKGVFPNWHKSPSFQEKYGKVRNASQTCIAPTGTLSIIANCTSGIEPAYGLVYEKHVLDGQTLYEVNPVFEQELKNRGIYSKGLLQKIADNNGSCQGIKEIPEDMQKVFVVAHDISPEWHVKMQAAFQERTGMGISKTINLPHNATKKDVEDALMLAYESGCNGVTVYRDGSREDQVLTAGKKEKPRKAAKVEVRERPAETSGVTTALKTGCGKLYATVNEDDEGVCEIFLNQRDGNGCRVAYNNALAMVSSMALRAGVPIKDISKAMKGQSCGKPVWDNGKLILSCPDAIGKHLDKEQEFQEFKESLEPVEKTVKQVKTCPLCGGQIISQGGCEICRDCGNSRCGG
jgi:ribonucleoside-diphosphate reductase alpha chain